MYKPLPLMPTLRRIEQLHRKALSVGDDIVDQFSGVAKAVEYRVLLITFEMIINRPEERGWWNE